MTNKDTIEWLMVVKDKFIPKDDDWYDEKYREAIDKAIKALEQEPKETWSIKDVATTFERHGLMTEQESCEDCISRAELLKAVDTWDKFGCDADTKLVPIKDCYVPYIHYDDVVKAIKGMPSIQTKTDVLDKIRAEIEQEYNRLSATRADETLEVGECLGLKMSLKIINKYTEEKE